jgi:hypothetical protein
MSREVELLCTLRELSRQSLSDFEVLVAVVGNPPSIDSAQYTFPISIIELEGNWDVGHVRNIGAARSIGHKLFFLDCDITTPRDFVGQAIQNINPGCVWFPIIRNSIASDDADLRGYRLWNFGNCGITRRDFEKVDGWDPMPGWGGEDVLFRWRCEMERFRFIRDESELVHRDHPRVTAWHEQRISMAKRVTEAKRNWLRKRSMVNDSVSGTSFLPRIASLQTKHLLLIGIFSDPDRLQHREACRTTWMQSAATHFDVTTLFVIGSADVIEPTLGGDTLFVPCANDRQYLAQKAYWLARWAQTSGFPFLFRCNDETFISVDRLMTLVRNEDFVHFRGYELSPGVAAARAGYLLSPRALAEVADANILKHALNADDTAVSQYLASLGIALTHDKRFWPSSSRVPNRWNNQITSSRLNHLEMLPLYQTFDAPHSSIFRVVDGYTEVGNVGLYGYRGFYAERCAEVTLPKDWSTLTKESLISAHASSRLDVDVKIPLRAICLLDAQAASHAVEIEVSVNGVALGRLTGVGNESEAVILNAGRHRLEAIACRTNRFCYTIWSLTADN